jgi:tRNA (uracil-5-)-methyltransferase TRM9
MDDKTINTLIEINRRFYDEFGQSFADTRRRIQPGVRRILADIQDGQNWLDLGCGSGALALEWARVVRQGSYTGLDFSPALLAEAHTALHEALIPAGLNICFFPADLSNPDWAEKLQQECGLLSYDGILAFAVLHHLPSHALRQQVLRQARVLLKPGGRFIHSEWQFQNSPRLMERRVDWATVGLSVDMLEEGDTLLDWRHALPGQPTRTGLRYVHLFSTNELVQLAEESGFKIINEFESDGEGGKLGRYQVWSSQ